MDSLLISSDRRGYPVTFFPSLEILAKHLRTVESAFFVTNSTVHKLYEQWFGNLAPVIDVPDSETSKDLQEYERIVTQLILHGADRQSVLVAIGGGVVGDLTGFVASTYMRGISVIQVPTTLLAMVDSAIGGKVGLNHELGKNMLGAIWPPQQVCVCRDFLRTLSTREYISGLAEVVKYGLIADPAFFEWCESSIDALLTRDGRIVEYAVKQSCRTKKAVVEADEHETGLRRILNFGHTMGHALESLSQYRLFSHGEAVYAGMVFAAVLSAREGKIGDDEVNRVTKAVRSLADEFLQRDDVMAFLKGLDFNLLWSAMARDKKAAHGRIRFVLLENIGKAYIASDVHADSVRSAFEESLERLTS
jgi:3-dehydroquinate synthase